MSGEGVQVGCAYGVCGGAGVERIGGKLWCSACAAIVHRRAAELEAEERTLASLTARELSRRLGVPCTDVATGKVYDEQGLAMDPGDTCSVCRAPRAVCRGGEVPSGDEICARADDSPEGAAGFVADRIAGVRTKTRDDVLAEVLGFLRQSEGDWTRLAGLNDGAVEAYPACWRSAVGDAKLLHDSQLVELFQRIGAVL